MSTPSDLFMRSVADGLSSKTLTSCYRWAAKRRRMGGDFSGPFSDKYHPWVRGMHDADAPFCWAMKGAQLGVTEVCINRTFYTLDALKRDVLYVLPTRSTATDFSKARFSTALALSPYIGEMFTDTNSVELKQTATNTLYIRGSGGKSDLVSIPVSELILDEVDRMDQAKIWLALERLSGQLRKRVWGISTPTIPNYGIHKLYQDSTQEHFVFPCLSCGRQIELRWPDSIEIIGEHHADPRCQESYLKCYECNAKLPHAAKPDFLANAYWESFDKNANPDIRGFHINQLYSFTVTPGDLVVAYFRGFGDEMAEQEFRNSKLGMPHLGNGSRVSEEMVARCVAMHSMDDPRPLNAERLITMGVDRGKWNFATIDEWTIDEWALDINATAKARTLFVLKFDEEDFDHVLDRLMVEWQVRACVLDADPGPMEARRFARRFPGYVWLCRYRDGQNAKEISIADDDSGAPMATVDRSHWLSTSLGRFKAATPTIQLPRDIPDEYRDHIQNLTSTYVKDELGNPRLTFVKTGPDHFAHSRTYSEIALPLAASMQMNVDIKRFN